LGFHHLPFGKLTVFLEKIIILRAKSTVSMGHGFNRKLLNYQRVNNGKSKIVVPEGQFDI
jgi:hypothetical protein